ncbi:MAG TPA: ankyrin repeat domain-containing protein [Bryobacteraceae bacterium]|nr:ankyrin repeat domain-containing protein [Bryobacteraceae bacterium]
MHPRRLPSRPSLEQYKKQAKNLLKAYKSADPDAVQRIQKHHPRLKTGLALADAQLVIAREHGFESWPKFVKDIQVFETIRSGDIDALKRLLRKDTKLATATLGGNVGGGEGESRSLLHVVTDWPGHVPNGAVMVDLLVEAGVDVNARFRGRHTETPLHWAASNDDVEVIDALLDRGADIEAPGGVIGGGTPLDDAVAFRQWKAAQRLVARGARTKLWHMAALGLLERVEERFSSGAAPTPDEVNHAFWSACHGGQRATAEYLRNRGADLNWIPPWEKMTPVDAARRVSADRVVEWLRSQGAKSAAELD